MTYKWNQAWIIKDIWLTQTWHLYTWHINEIKHKLLRKYQWISIAQTWHLYKWHINEIKHAHHTKQLQNSPLTPEPPAFEAFKWNFIDPKGRKHDEWRSPYFSLDTLPYPNAPWCWYIYLQNWVNFRANVGKYSMHGAYG